MLKYVLSPAAQQSLTNIRSYSIEQFGEKRTAEYLSALRNRMRELAADPSKGTRRDEIKKDYYSCYQGSHTIYYRIADAHLEIIDVLHQRMEPKLHL